MRAVVQQCCVWRGGYPEVKRMIIVVSVLMVLAWAQIWLAYLRVNNARERYAVQQNIEQVERDIARLSLEYASLTQPERLRRLAHETLGMRAPRAEQLVPR